MLSKALQISKQIWRRRVLFRYGLLTKARRQDRIKSNNNEIERAFYAPIFFNQFKSFSIILNSFNRFSRAFINLNVFSFFYILINGSYSLTLFQKMNTNGE